LAWARQTWDERPTELQVALIRKVASALELPVPEPASAAAAYRWLREIAESHSEQILQLVVRS
jgi:hypothetical protein